MRFKVVAYTDKTMRHLGEIEANNEKEAIKIAKSRLSSGKVSSIGISLWKFLVTECKQQLSE